MKNNLLLDESPITVSPTLAKILMIKKSNTEALRVILRNKNILREFRQKWDKNIFPLPDNFIWFNKISSLNNQPNKPGICYGLSLLVRKYKHNQKKVFKNLKVCVGIAIHPVVIILYLKDNEQAIKNNYFIPHAWNLTKKGEVIDFTWGRETASKMIYLGRIIPENETIKMKNSPCVRNYLWRLLGLETGQYWNEGTHTPLRYDNT